jgi:hypothetical protein
MDSDYLKAKAALCEAFNAEASKLGIVFAMAIHDRATQTGMNGAEIGFVTNVPSSEKGLMLF